jgi:hypothetical protein
LNFSKIRGDIRELMFITGANDTGEKFIAGVNDTGDNRRICRLFFLKIYLQENFPTLICHPRRRKCINLQTGGGGALPAQDTEIAAKSL